MHINSQFIQISPLSVQYNGDNEITSKYRFLSTRNIEQNIISMHNSIVDNKSFSTSLDVAISGNKLIITRGEFCINGYLFNLLNPLQISLTNYITTEPILYYAVYFKIQLDTQTIPYLDNSQLSMRVLNGQDTVNGLYSGVSLEVEKIQTLDYDISQEDRLGSNLLLCKLQYTSSDGWELIKNPRLFSRVKLNKMLTKITDSSVSKSAEEMDVETWLINEFIIDDGEIGE